MIGETISHYKILSRLGAGGMGVVYEAEDTRLGRKVAIKFLPDEADADPEAVQRFQREARVISNLNHPHICTLFDIGTHQGKQFMVMELLDGQSLKDRITHTPLSVDEVVEFGSQIADALEAAHAQGVVHRDIKPANLFVTSRGVLKVLDFGVAKLGQSLQGSGPTDSTIGRSDQLTTIGTTIGTVAYMSPEQARGQDLDERSDLFSAGVVLYEMATGQVPFQGATVATIFEGLLTKQPAPPSQITRGIPAELDRIILKALEKDRDQRYRKATELRADLKRLRRGETLVAPLPKPAPAWRKPVFVGGPLITVLLVAGLLVYRQITTPALVDKDPVVVSSFVNRTGDAMFDDTLGEALAMQLRQSPFLTVVPEQQVQATLRLMGREPMTPVTEEIGREVCQRAAAKALLGGTVAMLGSSYVITLSAQDCVDGDVLAEEQAQAASKEDVLAVLGNAVTKFRQQLGESLASIQRYDVSIEEATTKSLEALKAYSQAIRTRRMTSDFDSVPFFRRAIELDPEFALAYARLGTVYNNLGQNEEAKKMTARAYELRQKTSEAERLYIEARYFSVVEVDTQKALDAYNVWLATYPKEYVALANSAALHRQNGNVTEAIRKLELATQVAANEPLGFLNLGYAYLDLGQFAEARRAFETSINLRDATNARTGLYRIAVLTGDTALADAQVAAVRGRRDEADMTASRMFGAIYRGRFREASERAAEFQSQMVALSRGPAAGQALMSLAMAEALAGLGEAARDRVEAAEAAGVTDDSSADERLAVAAVLNDAGMARELMPILLAENKKSAPTPQSALRWRGMQALAALAEGRPADAAALLEPVRFEPGHVDVVNIWSLAKMQARDFQSAVKGLTFLTSKEGRYSINAITAFFGVMLARAQAALGQAAEARKSYEAFLELWKDADPELPLLVQAREEYAKLGS